MAKYHGVVEVKETIVNEKGLEYYEQWLTKDKDKRQRIGLTVSYDMGWNKRSSGHIYNSLSGHAFIIGAHTRRIIDCVVFSKKCDICTKRMNKLTETDNVTDTVLDLNNVFEHNNDNEEQTNAETELIQMEDNEPDIVCGTFIIHTLHNTMSKYVLLLMQCIDTNPIIV